MHGQKLNFEFRIENGDSVAFIHKVEMGFWQGRKNVYTGTCPSSGLKSVEERKK